MHIVWSIRRLSWMATAVVLAAAGPSCSSGPCDTPATFRCCEGSCIGSQSFEPLCTASGWACPGGFASSADCPAERFCLGPTGGTCRGAPVPATLRCCSPNCDSDITPDPVCSDAGWACPPDSVSFDDCPGPRVCMGALPGPLPDGGP